MRPPSAFALALTAPALMAQGSMSASVFSFTNLGRATFSIQGSGARALGTGGAFIGVADDASAVTFNPAGLAQMLKPEFTLAAASSSRTTVLGDPVGVDPASQLQVAQFDRQRQGRDLSYGSLVMPFLIGTRNQVIQVSRQRLFDLGAAGTGAFTWRDPSQGSGRGHADTFAFAQQGGVDVTSLAFSSEVTPRILLGLSFNRWRGDWTFAAATRDADGASTVDGSILQGNAFQAQNVNLGLLWRSELLNVGLSYRSPFRATYRFTLRQSATQDKKVLFEGSYDSGALTVAWPETLGVGLAFRPLDRLSLAADLSRTAWSQATIQAPSGGSTGFSFNGQNFFNINFAGTVDPTTRMTPPIPTPDCQDLRAGAEWIAFLGEALILPVRAGWFREPQPTVDSLGGQQRVFRGFTLGAGVKYRWFTLDLAYRRSSSRRNAQTTLPASTSTSPLVGKPVAGDEAVREHQYFLSLSLQGGYSDTVKKAIRWLLVGD